MNVRTKTKRRLIILLVCGLGMTAAIAGWTAWRRHALAQQMADSRRLGMAAADRGDDARAIEDLGRYLRYSNPNDVEALTRYIHARLNVSLPDNGHVKEAISKLEHLLDIAPDRIDDRRHLLHLEEQTGLVTETLDQANIILAKYPDDTDALFHKAWALMKLRHFDEALPPATHWADLAPQSTRAQVMVLEIMHEIQRPPSEILERAKALKAAHPGDGRFDLLMGYAWRLAGTQTDPDALTKAADELRAAARSGLDDPEFAVILVDQLDTLTLFDESLEQAMRFYRHSRELFTPREQLTLAQRLWEARRPAEVLEVTASLDASNEKTSGEILGLRAAALEETGDKAHALAICDALLSRHADPVAAAWAVIVRRLGGAGDEDAQRVYSMCQQGLRQQPEDAYLLYFQGDAAAEMGEHELAVRDWQAASRSNRTWALPLVRLAEYLADAGQLRTAREFAEAATVRAPRSARVATTAVRLMTMSLDAGQADVYDKLLEMVNGLGREETLDGDLRGAVLQARLSLLCHDAQTKEAAALLSKALASPEEMAESTVLRLADASRRLGLGLEDECFQRLEKSPGLHAEVALAWAVNDKLHGRAAQGLQRLEAEAAKHKDEEAVSWRLVMAQYLDFIGDPRAAAQWVKLGDDFPQDLHVQQIILAVPTLRGQREFLDRTINRVRKLGGEDGLNWRVARARWLMSSNSATTQDLNEASMLLSDVLHAWANTAEAQFLLGQCLDRLGDGAGAMEHLTAAQALTPSSVAVALYSAQVLQKRGDYEGARTELDRVARNPAATADQKRRAAILLAEQGQAPAALALLEAAESQGPGEPDLLLGKLYVQTRQFSKAEAVSRSLLTHPNPGVVAFAADLLARMGRKAEADKVLGMLAGLTMEPGARELVLADYYGRWGDAGTALGHFRAATVASPQDATTWKGLILSYVRSGRADEAVAAVRDAQKALGADPWITALAAQTGLFHLAESQPESRGVLAVWVLNPTEPTGAAEALAVLDQCEAAHQSAQQTTERLRAVADNYPNLLALQVLVAERYLALGRDKEAAAVATRAMQASPVSVDPAALATSALLASGSWEEAAAAARAWRQRSLDNPLAADMAVADAEMHLQRYDAARAQLEQDLDVALADADGHARFLVQYAQCLNLTGQEEKARDLLGPHLAAGAMWRDAWINVAAETLDDAAAARWLRQVAPIVDAHDSQDEEVVLGQAWARLAMKSGNKTEEEESRRLFDRLSQRADATASTLTACAMRKEQDGDLGAATAIYRRAMAAPGDGSVARNNLALLLVRHGGDLAEAQKLMAAALALHPGWAAFLDSRAEIQAKAKDYDAAVASLNEAVRLEPGSIKWRLNLAQLLVDCGRRQEAQKVLGDIDLLQPTGHSLPEPMKRQIQTLRDEVAKSS